MKNTINTLKHNGIKKTLLATAVAATVAFSGAANAGQNKRYNDDGYNSHSSYNNHRNNVSSQVDYARVLKVKPITKSVKVVTPVRECWDEQVRTNHRPHRSGHNVKGEIFGALIGAAVGNRVGKNSRGRNGRDIATAAGAVIGGVIGHDATNRRHHSNSGRYTYETVQQCETQQRVSHEEQVVAYKVRYKYRGQTYTTRMKNHPGNRLKVRVSVTPVEYS